jgi:hypothetical protein
MSSEMAGLSPPYVLRSWWPRPGRMAVSTANPTIAPLPPRLM